MKTFKRSFIWFLLFSFQCFFHSVVAQTPNWNWANGYSPNSVFLGTFKGLGTDASGNIYQAGYTLMPVTIGNTNVPAEKIFLLKHNSAGQIIWVKPQTSALNIQDLKVDLKGNIFLTGSFQDTARIGPSTLICQGKYDMFVAKYDSAGNGLWARRAGGIGRAPGFPPPITDEDGGTAIGADSAGNVYVSGYYYARAGITISFDSIFFNYPAGNFYESPTGFLVKYKPNGKIQWVRTVEGLTPGTTADEISVSKKGDSFLTGILGGNVTFGGGGPTLVSQGGTDVWYARYDTNGNLSWARSFGGVNSEASNGIAVNNTGEFFITGYFNNTTSIGSFPLTGTAQQGTLYLAKFNGIGVPLWASQTSGSGSIGDAVLTIDRQGNAFVGASYTGQITIGSQNFSTAAGVRSPIISKWTSTGYPFWAISGSGRGSCYGITLDTAATAVYLSGTYQNNLTFGNNVLNTPNYGLYLTKLSSSANGINEFSAADLKIYPNPAKAEINLDLSKLKGKAKLQLTDLQGKVLLTKSVKVSTTVRLDLPELAAGIYLLTAQTESQVMRQKIVIQ